jgi:hypothetical protein
MAEHPLDVGRAHTITQEQAGEGMPETVRGEVRGQLRAHEDLLWIDSESQTLLDRLVDSLPAARLLLLVNYRPEYQHAWGGKTYNRQLRIDPLPPERADELLETLLGPDAALGPLKRLLVARTEANPLFLEESVRALVETGAETAEVHYRQALTLAKELGMRLLVAHCHLGLGALAGRTGDRAKAEAHLTTATAMYREMDMGFWLEKAGTELQQLG